MRAEHLNGWIAASKRRKREATEEGEGTTDDKEGGATEPNWERLLDPIHTAFTEKRLAEEATWQYRWELTVLLLQPS